MKRGLLIVGPTEINICGKNFNFLIIEHCQEAHEEVYCQECQTTFCNSCFTLDHSTKMKQKHEKRPLEEKKEKCEKHQLIKKLYCYECNLKTCVECVLELHKTHKTLLYENEMDNIKKEILNQTNFKNNQEYIKSNLENVENNIKFTENLIQQLQNDLEKENLKKTNFSNILNQFNEIEDQFNTTKRIEDIQKIRNLIPIIDRKDVGKCIHTFHTSNIVNCICLMKDTIIVGSINSYFILDFSGALIRTSKINTNITAIMTYKSKSIVLGGEDFMIKTVKDQKIRTFKYNNHIGKVLCLIETKDGLIISGSEDKNIKVWNETFIRDIRGHTGSVLCLMEDRNNQLISGSSDKSIKVWNINGDCIKTMSGHSDSITAIVQSKNGNYLSASLDKTIKIWDQNFNCVKTYYDSSPINCLLERKDGMIISGSDQKIKVWDKIGCIESFIAHSDPVTCLIENDDGNIISASKGEKSIKIWQSNLFKN